MNNIVFAGRHALTHNVSRHVHVDWELIYCTSGGGRLIFSNLVLDYKADDIIIIPPMLPHSNESECGFTNIFFNLADSTLSGNRPFVMPSDKNDFMLSAFSAIFFYYSKDARDNQSLLSSYGNLMVSFIMSHRQNDPRSDSTLEIENDIIRNFSDATYDLTAYLDTLPFNNDYLIKLFKKDTGTTPHRYLADKRLDAAANAIISSQSDCISDIARLCGFREPLYFSRLFKKKYGVSPSFYTKEAHTSTDNGSDPDSVKIYLD